MVTYSPGVQLPLTPATNGATIAEDPEAPTRLGRQLKAVYTVLRDGEWHLLPELARVAESSTQSASARLRDLRKPRWGAHHVEREHIGGGVYRYRMLR